jgi:2-oxoglutarate/2-oxoacid ferredoxin oxidoreductase subunit beta
VVSGIGCTGRVARLRESGLVPHHARARDPLRHRLKLANPDLDVVVYSGDGDLFAIGGNHFIHAARRNVDIKVVCVNNLIYAMTGGQTAPTTPGRRDHLHVALRQLRTVVQPAAVGRSGGRGLRRSLDHLPRAQLAKSMFEMFNKKGFSFIEVLSPCPTLYQRRNKMGDGMETMKFYKEKSKRKDGAPTADAPDP